MTNGIIAEASVDVNEAPRQAEKAQQTANEAKNLSGNNDQSIKNINDPNYLSPFEKPQLEIQMANFANIYKSDKNIAAADGIDFTAYDTAYQAYLAYMTPLVADMTTYSPIDRDTYNSIVLAVQNAQKAFDLATNKQYDDAMNSAKADIAQAGVDLANQQASYAAMQTDVANIKSDAVLSDTKATTAISTATSAASLAVGANQSAGNATTVANTAMDNANTAMNSANSALSNANNASTLASSAGNNANNAISMANSASTNANNAINAANSAGVNANVAMSSASVALNEFSNTNGRNIILNSRDLTTFRIWKYDGPNVVFSDDKTEATISTTHGGLNIENINLSKNLPDYGDTITFSVEAKGTAHLQLNYNNGHNFLGAKNIQLTDDYKRYSIQYIWSPVANTNQNFVIFSADSSLLSMTVKNPMINIGSIAKAYSPAPDDVQTQITNINGELDTKVSQKTFDTLSGAVTSNSTDILQNKSDIGLKANQTTVDTIKQTVDSQATSITENAGEIALKANQTDVDKLSSTVSSQNTSITENANNIALKADQSVVDLLNKTATANSTAITENANEIALKASQDTIDNLSGTVKSQGTSILANSSSLALKANQSLVDTLNKTVASQGTSITTNSNALALKADNSVVNTLSGNVTANASAIALNSKSIQSKVSQTDFDNLSIGGRNLILNSRDLTTFDWWQQDGHNPTYSADKSEMTVTTKHGGLTIKPKNLSSNSPSIGDTVTLSIEVKGNFHLDLDYNNGSGFVGGNNIVVSSSSEFKRCSRQFIWNPSSSGNKEFDIYTADPTDTTMTIRRPKLEISSIASDWSPAPEDAINSIESVRTQTATLLAGKVSDSDFTSYQAQTSGTLATMITSADANTAISQTSANILAKVVAKGDVVNQFNIDAGGALLQTTGANTKLVFSSPNIVFDSSNPVTIPELFIPKLLTGTEIHSGKFVGTGDDSTIDGATITSTSKIVGADIEAATIHSPDNSFKLDGPSGVITGVSIGAKDGSWSISKDGKFSGGDFYAGGQFTYNDITGTTYTGALYSELNSAGFHQWSDQDEHVRINKGYMLITNKDDEQANPHVTGVPNGTYISRDDSQFQGSVEILKSLTVGNLYTNGAHTINSVDGGGIYFEQGYGTGNSMVDIYTGNIQAAGTIQTGNITIGNSHSITMQDGAKAGTMYFSDRSGSQSYALKAKSFSQTSLLSLKTDITAIDPHDALIELVKNDFMSYHYKTDNTNDPKTVSVILDDINPIPEYYTSDIFKSADGTGRNDGNVVGYLALSVKDLNSREIADKAKIAELETRLQKLEGAN